MHSPRTLALLLAATALMGCGDDGPVADECGRLNAEVQDLLAEARGKPEDLDAYKDLRDRIEALQVEIEESGCT